MVVEFLFGGYEGKISLALSATLRNRSVHKSFVKPVQGLRRLTGGESPYRDRRSQNPVVRRRHSCVRRLSCVEGRSAEMGGLARAPVEQEISLPWHVLRVSTSRPTSASKSR